MRFITCIILCFNAFFAICQAPDCFEECFYEPDAVCFLVYDPVCGCDGVEYSNSCFALVAGIPGWTQGICENLECENSIEIEAEYQGSIGTDDEPQTYAADEYCFSVESELELSSEASYFWDLGSGETSTESSLCALFPYIEDGEPVLDPYHIVLTVTDGECVYVYNIKIDHEDSDDCMDLAGIDFGACLMVIGVAVIDNSCTSVSGCSTLGSDNVDYSEYFFESLEACNAQCPPCIDESMINLEVICPTVVTPVCGCNGVTYNNGCEAENWHGVTSYTDGPCDQIDPEPCDDLADVDFGPCDAVLGVGILNGLCTTISGCDVIASNGVDYSDAIFPTMLDCVSCDQSECYNPNQENPNGACDDVYEPVCGCNEMTYSNECEAINAGITSWEEGECLVNSIYSLTNGARREMVVFPNPAERFFYLETTTTENTILIKDNSGRTIKSIDSQLLITKVDIEDLESGMYFIQLIRNEKESITSRLIVHQ